MEISSNAGSFGDFVSPLEPNIFCFILSDNSLIKIDLFVYQIMMASIFTRDKKNIGSKKTNNVYKKQSLPRTLASLNLPTANGFDILREPRNGVNLSVQTQKYEDKVFNYTKNSPIAYRNNNLSFFSGYSFAKVNALNLAREKDLK
ncbi:hypothetical protein O9G_005345 [Rozella allomycis CSF55]|uniref:Uncharacterized protein n=1 Tax=Rozella allomycis (strain CSF55) TaxID=988480 RepID=A0A075B1F8_ROZAC|nr:hypothetical protein O9G_005345 [Rozella allomycis CSF55]|eukprot:EPZ36426.1 hypothetical protein O9G_005345 [Rozella allomycis CSF55]